MGEGGGGRGSMEGVGRMERGREKGGGGRGGLREIGEREGWRGESVVVVEDRARSGECSSAVEAQERIL